MMRRNFVRTLRSYYSSLAGNLPISQVVSSRVIFRSTHNHQENRSGPSTCHMFSAGLNISPTVPFFISFLFTFQLFSKFCFCLHGCQQTLIFQMEIAVPNLPSPPLPFPQTRKELTRDHKIRLKFCPSIYLWVGNEAHRQ